jgi:hypothetical protein
LQIEGTRNSARGLIRRRRSSIRIIWRLGLRHLRLRNWFLLHWRGLRNRTIWWRRHWDGLTWRIDRRSSRLIWGIRSMHLLMMKRRLGLKHLVKNVG